MSTKRLDLDHQDEVIVLLGLVLVHELLPRSSYPPEVQEAIKNRADALIKKIQTPQQYDAYGNPYES